MNKAILTKEISSNWKTPWGYLKATGFLVLAAYFFMSLLESYNGRVAQFANGQVVIEPGFVTLREWVVRPYYEALVFFLIFFAPLGSMGMIADELRGGTFYRLHLSPVSSFSLVIGKFSACILELLIWMILVSIPALSLCYLEGESFLPCLLGAIVFCLAGVAFLAWGLACSSMVRHPIGAVAMSVGTLFLLYFSHSFFSTEASSLWRWLSPAQQANAILDGFIQPMNFGYFVAFTLGAVVTTIQLVETERRV